MKGNTYDRRIEKIKREKNISYNYFNIIDSNNFSINEFYNN